jgi:hypothetical protein
MKLLILILFLFVNQNLSSQPKLEEDIEKAFQNAKKGIYWALENIPEKKASLDQNLIADDILYSTIKLSKQIDGIKVQSKGYFHSNEVIIIIYRSNESLITDGFIAPVDTSDVLKK